MRPDPGVNAARLIALLPHGASPDIRPRMTVLGRGVAQSWTDRQVIVYAIILVVMLVLHGS